MRKDETPYVAQRLRLLIGQPLQCAGCAADMLTLSLGREGEFSLHIQCSYRMATEAHILFDRIDYFRPSKALQANWIAQGLREENFPQEWPDEECRLFESVKQLCDHLEGLTVEAVEVNRLGDLTLRFAGGVTLLALTMSSDADDECWRFWNDALWPDQHMVVYGDHVELHGPGERCSGICE
ncbi:MAG: hypothetical protein IJB81_01035 [Clostridia bacterium]|nr:hypothetical protein [Clostridia bacterium]